MTKSTELLENVKDFSSVLDQITYLNDLIPFYSPKFFINLSINSSMKCKMKNILRRRLILTKKKKTNRKNIKCNFPYLIENGNLLIETHELVLSLVFFIN